MTFPSLPDPPVKLQGYVTDPKLVGYQILTNYENTYWLRLVGRDAWVLYLVLRSFCHEGHQTCNPSIKTLMEILGLTDRRQLIGRADEKGPKKRVLPGLIDVLQEHQLVTAEVRGEGPDLRYVFHINLTPPLLTLEQLSRLPQSLQKKHAQLLARVTEAARKMEELNTHSPMKVKKTLTNKIPNGALEGSSPESETEPDMRKNGGVIQYQGGGWYSTTQTIPN